MPPDAEVLNMAEMRFDGRVALITGAGNGLGRAYARLLASRGAQVVVNDLGAGWNGEGASEGPANTVVGEIREAGGVAIADTHDIGEQTGAAAAVRTALEAFGRIDIVVNNAGFGVAGPLAEYSTETFRKMLDVNFMGSVWTCQAAWPHMQKARYGRIVNTSSSSIYGLPQSCAYASAKAGILGLTRVIALDGAAHNIKCNAIAPSGATRGVVAFPESEIRRFIMGYLAPELAAVAVGYLAHEQCPVSGECIASGGGRVDRIFIGQTHGYVDRDITVEKLRDHFSQVMDTANFEIHADNMAALRFCAKQLGFKDADKIGWFSTQQ